MRYCCLLGDDRVRGLWMVGVPMIHEDPYSQRESDAADEDLRQRRADEADEAFNERRQLRKRSPPDDLTTTASDGE